MLLNYTTQNTRTTGTASRSRDFNTKNLAHLKWTIKQNTVEVALIDLQGHEIVKGYGKSESEALNDLHLSLI